MEKNVDSSDFSNISKDDVAEYIPDKDNQLTDLKPVGYDYNELPKSDIFNELDINDHKIDSEITNKNPTNVIKDESSTKICETDSKSGLSSCNSTSVDHVNEIKEECSNQNEASNYSSDAGDPDKKTPDSSPSTIPGKSRYGRVRKPKLSTDFVSVDKKSFAVLNNVSSYEHIYSNETPHKIPNNRKNKRSYRRRSNVLLLQNESEPQSPAKLVKKSSKKIGYITQSSINKSVNDASSLENETAHQEDCSLYDSALNSKDIIKTYSRKNETLVPSSTSLYESQVNERVENDNDESLINYPELNWKVGDVAWARIGCFPYWPSIITLEYGSSIYVKSGNRNKLAVHVQFFGDTGRRSWILTTNLIMYQSKEQFFELKERYKKDKIRMKYFLIKPSFSEFWEKATSEADTTLKLPHDERTKYYQSLYPISEEMYLEMNTVKVKRYPLARKKNPDEKRGRKRKILNDTINDLVPEKIAKKTMKFGKKDISGPSEEKKTTREPMDEHIRKRRAFIRRMNKILKQSNERSDYSIKKGLQNGRKLQRLKNATFNKLLNKENEKNKQNLNTSIDSTGNCSSSDGSHRKNDISVYDFESDDETDVFIGTYNSRFTPQILAKIDQEKNEKLTNGEEVEESPIEKEDNAVEPKEIKKRKLFEDGKTKSSLNAKNNMKASKDMKKSRPRKPVDWLKRSNNCRPSRSTSNPFRNALAKRLSEKMANNTKRRGRKIGQKSKKVDMRIEKENDKKKNRERIKKNEKKSSSFETFRAKFLGKVTSEHSHSSENEIDKYLEKMWNELSDSQKLKYKCQVKDDTDVNSDDDDDGDDEFKMAEKRRSSSPLPVSRSKKGTIFAGLKFEKICQICEKPGETVRCKGSCGGHYHIECVNKLADKKLDKTKKLANRTNRRNKSTAKLENEKTCEIGDDKSSESKAENSTAQKNQKSEVDENSDNSLKPVNDEEDDNEPKQPRRLKIMKEDISEAKKLEKTDTTTDIDNNSETLSNHIETPDKKCSEFNDTSNNVSDKSESKAEIGETEKESEEVSKCVENGINNDIIENDETVRSDVSENLSNSTKVENSNGIDFRCKFCADGVLQPCFICGKEVEEKTGESERFSCYLAYCGRAFHRECLKAWPQATWGVNSGKNRGSINGKESLMCPQHNCHTCISDNPAVLKNKVNNEKLVKCIRCPTAYHQRVHCIPAESELLTMTQIICPRHYEPPKTKNTHVNAYWCFICCVGGSLICCEECPTSFHVECLKLSPEEYEGKYICDDCQTGRYLLYGEVVWVKLGYYRWWPAQILFPHQIPENILNMPHRRGEFVVEFFGSHDYYWINRGRSFLYQEGDSGRKNCKKKTVDLTFERALIEADEAYQKQKSDKALRDEEAKVGLKPPRYVKIKANKPVGKVRIVELNTSNIADCKCDPSSERPCAPESNCLNRMLLVECNPKVCSAGERCLNQAFEKRLYPPLIPYRTDKRGWGLKTLVDIKKGDFIIEYVGEMIDEEEYKKRISHMYRNQEDNYYFLTIDKDRMLDAGPKGNVARFMNHSCDPNCETQKWTVNGDTRVGLFALKSIPANTELVFNYNLATLGNEMKPCLCGSEKCSGFIGVKAPKNGNNGDEESRKKSNEENRKRSIDDVKKKGRLSKRRRKNKKLVKRLKPKSKQKPKSSSNKVPFKMKLVSQSKRKGKKKPVAKKNQNYTKALPDEEQTSLEKSESQINETSENRDSEEIEKSGIKSEESRQDETSIMEAETASPENELKTDHISQSVEVEKTGEKNAKNDVAQSAKDGVSRKQKTSIKMKKSLSSAKLRNSNIKKGKNPRGRKPLLKNQIKMSKKQAKKKNSPIKSKDVVGVVKKKRQGRKPFETDQERQQSLIKSLKKRIQRKIEDSPKDCKLDETCFICGGEGQLFVCDNKVCPRRYHITCVKKYGWPKGRWLCPWHYCKECNSRRQVVKCCKCINAFCPEHVEGNIFRFNLKNFICRMHKSGGKKNELLNSTDTNKNNTIELPSDLSNVTKPVQVSRNVGRRSKPFKNKNIGNVVIKEECLSDVESEKPPEVLHSDSDDEYELQSCISIDNQNDISTNSPVSEIMKPTDSYVSSDDDYTDLELEVIQVEDS